jgi:hypothetical protein
LLLLAVAGQQGAVLLQCYGMRAQLAVEQGLALRASGEYSAN